MQDEKDEFDLMIDDKDLADKISSGEKKGRKKKATDGMKQTKLNFPKKKVNDPKGISLAIFERTLSC